MRNILIFLLFSISYSLHAAPFSELYVSLKNNNACFFTKNSEKNMTQNEILIYMGKIEENIEFKTSYSKTYKNLETPTNEENCLQIPLVNFEMDIPYEIWVETNQEYKQRICLSKSSNKIQLTKVIDGYQCGKEIYDYSDSNVFARFIIWMKSLFI